MSVSRTRDPRKILAERIREERERSRLTQEELGKLLDVSPTSVSKHESGVHGVPAELIERYARVFKLPSWQLTTHYRGEEP